MTKARNATKRQALATARRLGMVLDESVTGRIGEFGCVTLDHLTHSFGGDCRSITCSGYQPMSELWAEAIARMDDECGDLVPCADPQCDYHNGGEA